MPVDPQIRTLATATPRRSPASTSRTSTALRTRVQWSCRCGRCFRSCSERSVADHVHHNDDGLLEAWRDGEKVYTQHGPNTDMFDECNKPLKQQVYLKIGIYKAAGAITDTTLNALRATRDASLWLAQNGHTVAS